MVRRHTRAIGHTIDCVVISNAHFRHLAEAVKRGVWEAGGFPVEFPVTSLGESVMKPTTMLFRYYYMRENETELISQTEILCQWM